MPNKQLIFFIKFWLPVLIWCSVIYYFSSVPNLKSDLSSELDFVLRKIAHMSEYGILTFLFFRAAAQKLSHRKSIVFSIIFSISYSLTDEYHQLFVAGRSGSLMDVFIDTIGIFSAAFLIDKKPINASIKS